MDNDTKNVFRSKYSYTDNPRKPTEQPARLVKKTPVLSRAGVDYSTSSRRTGSGYFSPNVIIEEKYARVFDQLVEEKGDDFRFISELKPEYFNSEEELRDFVDFSIKEFDDYVIEMDKFQRLYWCDFRGYLKLKALDDCFKSGFIFNLINNFFNNSDYSEDAIFRWIEINEFIHRGSKEQTLEDFLLTDNDIVSRASNMSFINYGPLSVKISELKSYDLPRFMLFGNEVNGKTRKLLAQQTKETFEKLLSKLEDNPYLRASSNDSASFNFVKIFLSKIDAKPIKIKYPELKYEAIYNNILTEIFSRKDYWRNRSESNVSEPMTKVSEHLESILTSDESFIKIMSYFIGSRTFEKLSPRELVQSIIGLKNSKRYAVSPKGLDLNLFFLDKIQNDELDPLVFLKIIAVANEEKKAIVVDEDFEMKSLENIPTDWAINLFERKEIKLNHMYITSFIS